MLEQKEDYHVEDFETKETLCSAHVHNIQKQPSVSSSSSSSHSLFLRKGVLKISSKFYKRSPMPTFKIAPRHVCSPVNLLRIFRTPFPKNSSGCRAVRSSSTLKVPNLKRALEISEAGGPTMVGADAPGAKF